MRWMCRHRNPSQGVHAQVGIERREHRNPFAARTVTALGVAAVALLAGGLFAYPSSTAPRLLVNQSVTPQVAALFPRYNAVNAIILYTGAMDPDNDGRLNMDVFVREIEQTIPRTYTGPVCLDWEGCGMMALQLDTQTYAFQYTLQEYVKGLEVAKKLRPYAQFGYYALPMGSFVRDENWVNMQLALQPIYDVTDCFFPSVYDVYATGEPYTNVADDLSFVRATVEMALRVSDGKPVYPYIAARYHESNAQYGLRLIPAAEFKQHVSEVFEARYGNYRASGIVWWGGDRYFLWLSRQNFPVWHPLHILSLHLRQVFAEEFLPGETDDQYFTRIHKVILKRLNEVVSAVR